MCMPASIVTSIVGSASLCVPLRSELRAGLWDWGSAASGRAFGSWAAPLGGIPPEQLALVDRRPKVFSERIREILATRMWSSDNYFYHGYCCGHTTERN